MGQRKKINNERMKEKKNFFFGGWWWGGNSRTYQNEENGANGAKVFKQNREHEMNSTSWAFESDSGVFSYVLFLFVAKRSQSLQN